MELWGNLNGVRFSCQCSPMIKMAALGQWQDGNNLSHMRRLPVFPFTKGVKLLLAYKLISPSYTCVLALVRDCRNRPPPWGRSQLQSQIYWRSEGWDLWLSHPMGFEEGERGVCNWDCPHVLQPFFYRPPSVRVESRHALPFMDDWKASWCCSRTDTLKQPVRVGCAEILFCEYGVRLHCISQPGLLD